jgi:hypothetical protein
VPIIPGATPDEVRQLQNRANLEVSVHPEDQEFIAKILDIEPPESSSPVSTLSNAMRQPRRRRTRRRHLPNCNDPVDEFTVILDQIARLEDEIKTVDKKSFSKKPRPKSILQTEHEARMEIVVKKLVETVASCDSLKTTVNNGQAGRNEICSVLQNISYNLELLVPLVKDRPAVPKERKEMFISGDPDDLARSGAFVIPVGPMTGSIAAAVATIQGPPPSTGGAPVPSGSPLQPGMYSDSHYLRPEQTNTERMQFVVGTGTGSLDWSAYQRASQPASSSSSEMPYMGDET